MNNLALHIQCLKGNSGLAGQLKVGFYIFKLVPFDET